LEEGNGMMLSQRTRANHGKYAQGCGGRNCVCCDHSPKYNKSVRRSMRRVEKQQWKKEL